MKNATGVRQAALGTMLVLLACHHASADAPTIDQVLTAWRQRQERVVSARFVVEEEMTRPKGTISMILKAGGMQLKEGTLYPPVDHTYSAPLYVSVDGDKMRIDYKQLDWREKIEEDHQIFTFDGKSGKIFYRKGEKFPLGAIRSENYNRHVGNFHIRAIMMTIRALHPKIAPAQGATYALTGRHAVIGGAECWEVAATQRNQVRTVLWIDTARGFLPVRYIISENRVDTMRLDVTYQEQADIGWAPASWSLMIRDWKGRVSESVRAKVAKCEINVAIASAEFDPEFPVGTYVVNDKTNVNYIQKEGGEKRVVARSERSKPYEELLRTPEPSSRFATYVWPAVTVAFVTLMFGIVYRTRRRASQNRAL